jgi:iron complex outermembrane recepter protein
MCIDCINLYRKNMNKTIILFLIIYGFLHVSGTYAQTTEQIRLLDADNALPVQGATYNYGKQHGISDKNGIITFTPVNGAVMKISHLNYGSWEWDEKELRKSIPGYHHFRTVESGAG